jgi:hypothetical protein
MRRLKAGGSLDRPPYKSSFKITADKIAGAPD